MFGSCLQCMSNNLSFNFLDKYSLFKGTKFSVSALASC